MKKRDVILFVSIFVVLLLISGGTYAYWIWTSDTNKDVVFNTSKAIEEYITYDEGDSHFVGDFQPSSNMCDGVSNTISFSKTSEASDVNLVATINMDVNHTINSSAVKWALINDEYDCYEGSVIASGDFSGVSSGQTVELYSNMDVLEETQSYTIWLWVTSADSSLSGQTIDVNIWTQIDMLASDACIIHYKDLGNWVQEITDGQPFTLPSSYSAYYVLDESGNETGVCLDGGSTVTYPCGTSFNANYDLC